jgi:hypothetical protein
MVKRPGKRSLVSQDLIGGNATASCNPWVSFSANEWSFPVFPARQQSKSKAKEKERKGNDRTTLRLGSSKGGDEKRRMDR